MKHQTATLCLFFENADDEAIVIDKVIEVDIPTRSIEFRQNNAGGWNMVVTKAMLHGRKLRDSSNLFLTAFKNP